MTLNDELSQIANTPQLERIANELERTSSQLYFNFQELLRIDCKIQLSAVDTIQKKKIMDNISKLILKL